MLSPAKRLLLIIAAIGFVAACSNTTAPAPSHIDKPTAPRFDMDSTMCRSGYNVGQGRCNGDS